MTALTQGVAATPATSSAGIPFLRLLNVEFRKLFDTRAARVLLSVMIAGAVGLQLVVLFTDDSSPIKLSTFFEIGITPIGMLLPVVAIMSTTAEWSQRTNLITFMWEPRRGHVLTAKFVAGLIVAVLGILAVMVSAVVCLGLGAVLGKTVSFELDGSVLLGVVVMMLVSVAQGIAFGALIHNTAGALVAYFVLPMVVSMVFMMVNALRDVYPWVDLNSASSPIMSGSFESGEVARFATSVAVWVVLPGIIGVWRTINREAK